MLLQYLEYYHHRHYAPPCGTCGLSCYLENTMTQSKKLTYSKAKKGDMIFYHIPGVSFKATQAAVLDKQPPNAITVMDVNTKNIYFMSKEQFNNNEYMNVTSEMIAKEMGNV